METLLIILKVILIGIVTPIGAALVIWELVQAVLGRPPRQHTLSAEPQGDEGEA